MSTPPPTSPGAAQRSFNEAELAQYDGKEGRPAYVAYEGLIYDVTGSKLWRNGVHVRQHQAGEDLTAAMPAAPHDHSVMERWPVVGRLAEPEEPEAAVPLLYRLSLDNHLHPVAVHFPIALGVLAPGFALASLLFVGKPLYDTFQQVAFWNLVICALGTIPGFATGVISWYFNYKAQMNQIYWVKWVGSIILVMLSAAALLTYIYGLEGRVQPPGGPAYWTYMLLLILHAPVVVVLGHYGGRITFPR
jgi:predicted heme/steroid binding protein/uncharacterized membrane protein